MNYFNISRNNESVTVTAITDNHKEAASTNYESRWDWKSLEDAEKIAAAATEYSGELYIAVDAGEWVSNRYDVILAPKVGDKVSYAFNGDYYPDGEIVSISKSMKKITTSSGKSYYRKRNTGAWVYSKTWTMVKGHKSELNPHF
jgi:predicted Zn-dependent protease